MQPTETPVQGETQSGEALGNPTTPPTVAESTATAEKPVEAPAESSDATPTASVEELQAQIEAERKSREKAEMRARQLENERQKQKETELAEQGKYQELYEEAQKRLADLESAQEAQKAEAEARTFRDSIINNYDDPLVREIAKKANLSWDESAETLDDAKAQLTAKLDEIKATVNPEQTPTINPNNPHQPPAPPLDRKTAIEEASKNRDFTDILKSIPSVAEQVKRVEEGQ